MKQLIDRLKLRRTAEAEGFSIDSSPGTDADGSRQHIVFLNWRDSRHPQAGGAELYCESVARGMAERGDRVTLLTAGVAGAPREEVVEGVTVRRRGGRFGVYLCVLWWLCRHRGDVDAVVDFQNGIPFFSPLVMPHSTPIVCVVFHVHQEQFNVYFRWPLNRLGRWLEGPAARRIYGRRPLVVISPSTRADVRRKLRLKGPIFVVPCGMDRRQTGTEPSVPRSVEPRIACVGRLMPHKQLNLLLASLPEVLAEFPRLKVDIMGTGTAESDLRRQAQDTGIGEEVTFHGRVTDETRDQLLERAWMTVNPSAGEGWGLSVLEANACGVPAIAFRVPGLQDAVREGETGWLVERDGSLGLTIVEALRVLSDPARALEWRRRAIEWASHFNWDWTTLRIEALLADEGARLTRATETGRDARSPSDLACRVELRANTVNLRAVQQVCRRTDVWRRDGDQLVALLHGADESGVRLALSRAGVVDEAEIHPARASDWLLGGVPPHHGDG